MRTMMLVVFWTAFSLVVGFYVVHLVWRARSAYRVARAEPAAFAAHREVLWRDPGQVDQLDLTAGPGGRGGIPTPPFHFVEEHTTGTCPCISVTDSRRRTWRVKWGDEVRSETFAVRLIWAGGFFAETTHFVPEGRVEDANDLQRARTCIDESQRFTDARFELSEEGVTRLFEEHGWSWIDNPFVGTHELNGLKILMMLLSNWDNKDVRDVARGSNTAIFQHHLGTGVTEARYLIIDWGGAMGRWGSVVSRGKWDVAGYEAQTPSFITGVAEDVVSWGYSGQRTADAAAGIGVDDVRWLWKYVGRLTDAQIASALEASGATADEVTRFAAAIRARLEQLRRVAEQGNSYVPDATRASVTTV